MEAENRFMRFELTDFAIEPASLRSTLSSPSAGAFCSYEGWVRDSNVGKDVSELHYSSYPELAESMAGEIMEEAAERFDLIDVMLVHRIGALKVGEIAVWIGVTAAHRGDTFLACRYIIDNVKYRLPIWKKEIYVDGSSEWVESSGKMSTDSPLPAPPDNGH